MHKTFIVPQEKTKSNIPGNESRCGPPRDVNEYKDDSWKQLTQLGSLSDQGEWVDYVRHRPRVVLPVLEAAQS